MVNAAETTNDSDRRERPRDAAAHQGILGASKLNPFGDLHTLQHLSARLARSLRGVFEPILRQEIRCWAEPAGRPAFRRLSCRTPRPADRVVADGDGARRRTGIDRPRRKIRSRTARPVLRWQRQRPRHVADRILPRSRGSRRPARPDDRRTTRRLVGARSHGSRSRRAMSRPTRPRSAASMPTKR